MKINDGNIVQGLYNANTTPPDVVFTTGDLVVYGATLFTCKGDTTSKPAIGDPHWEIYMGDKWEYLNDLTSIETANPTKINYIGPEGLSQFLKSRLGGLNSNGRLQVLTDASLVALSSLTANSVFNLSYQYLTHPSVESLPFIPANNKVYVVRTIGELDNPSGSMFVQEIIEYPQSGQFRSWVRFGADLSLAVWSPTRGTSFDSGYITAMNNIVASYISAKVAYEGVLNNIHTGNFYSFELVNLGAERSSIRFTATSELINSSLVNLNTDYHYKIFLKKDIGSGNFQVGSIDVTPNDFLSSYEENSSITYSHFNTTLVKDLDSNPANGWTLSGACTITRILKAKNLIS